MTNIETTISRVTVYTERAQVTRSGRVQLEAGVHRLELRNLPANLASETVRTRARATVPARILASDTVSTFLRERPESKPAEIEKRLKELQEQDEALVLREGSVTVRRGFIQSLANSSGTELARGIALGRIPMQSGAFMVEFLEEQLHSLEVESIELSSQRREIALEIGVLKSQLNSQQQQPVERKTVIIQVELEAAGELGLDVSYQLSGASWTPVYDVRVSECGDRPLLSLVYQAQVTQQTGEDWGAVALTLSTAKPAASAFLPELKPWFLNVSSPMAAMGGMRRRTFSETAAPVAAPMGAMAMSAMESGASAFDEEAEVAVAEVSDSGPVLSFDVTGGTDIPSDGSPHKVTLGFHQFPVRLDYVTAPKMINQAFRRALATNESGLLLLPGTAQVFHEDEFVGTARLKTLAPGQKLELFLGVDDRIHVERKLIQGTVDRKFLADVRRLGYGYEVTVTNLRDRAELVTVLDQLPVSRHESVKVRKGEVRPEPAEQNDLGDLRWELRLEPRQSRSVRFAFTIEASRELTLLGLPPLTDEGVQDP